MVNVRLKCFVSSLCEDLFLSAKSTCSRCIVLNRKGVEHPPVTAAVV